jgi:competence protein ComEC
VAFYVWSITERPDVLIAESGALVGVMTAEGRALSRGKGSGFVARSWLENDGDANLQEVAGARWAGRGDQALEVEVLRGKRAAAELSECAGGAWVVLNVDPEQSLADLPCHVLHPATLRKTGALALYAKDGGARVLSARDVTGQRLWNTPELRNARTERNPTVAKMKIAHPGQQMRDEDISEGG